jgi:hypothetical protein
MGEDGETQEYSLCGRTTGQLKVEVDSQLFLFPLHWFILNYR